MMGKKELQCKLKTAFIPYPHIVIHIPLTWHVAIDYKFNRLFKITLHTIRKKKTFNPLGASPTKWSNTLKQFVGILPTNCLSVFDHFVGLARKGLNFLLNAILIFEKSKKKSITKIKLIAIVNFQR